MAKFELRLPKMGESVAEATITSWLKEVGDTIELDEAVVEIATDKVDSEVPSEVEGVLLEKRFAVDDVVKVGEVLAVIETAANGQPEAAVPADTIAEEAIPETVAAVEKTIEKTDEILKQPQDFSASERFYSPLVKTIAQKENVSMDELEALVGTGKDNRVTKNDILAYIESRTTPVKSATSAGQPVNQSIQSQRQPISEPVVPVMVSGSDEIIEMSRMGKLIAKHMIESVHTSAHVQSFIEIDVTNIVKWREKVKDEFLRREGEKITYTPVFMQAVAATIKKFPMVNISVDGEKIIKHRNINLGMAAALADGNLIVPVIKNADALSLIGMTKVVNDLANRARANQLKPDEIQGGTYTVTNVGSFGSIMGTPIINQPQVAILALGAIRKVPAVIETPEGDLIGIRHKMFVSHSYDHRVVNGALGGMFIKSLKETLEAWDVNAGF
ncbi:MAG: 2-oxo acid dehydrogenase subunit E2 [Flavobacteriaceae bacterium]|nr:2-oxo acid dehydrogenase subunit E2 [Flavobacteriaceae bacterium]